MSDVNCARIAAELRRLLLVLASPGDAALAREPIGSARADGLASAYVEILRAFVASCAVGVTLAQRDAVLRVHALLDAMSGPQQPELWTDDAVRDHPRWLEVRAAAHAALAGFGWNPVQRRLLRWRITHFLGNAALGAALFYAALLLGRLLRMSCGAGHLPLLCLAFGAVVIGFKRPTGAPGASVAVALIVASQPPPSGGATAQAIGEMYRVLVPVAVFLCETVAALLMVAVHSPRRSGRTDDAKHG